MRNSFINTVYNLTAQDKNIYLMTGDLGFGVLTKYWETYPNNFINAGIAEQNMASVAAGLALEGKTVFIYSIANFPTLRCLEQIRNNIAYHKANVKIISIGAGFAYGGAGMTHHATEDIAILRAIPNMTVFSPADPQEAVEVTKKAYEIEGPCYIRLGKGQEVSLHAKPFETYEIGQSIPVYDGDTVAIFATGAIAIEGKIAAEKLNAEGIKTAFYTFPTIKPIDENIIGKYAKKCKIILSVEEHNLMGGFGSAIAEVLVGISGEKAVMERIGLKNQFSEIVGNQAYLRKYYKMTAEDIYITVKNKLKE